MTSQNLNCIKALMLFLLLILIMSCGGPKQGVEETGELKASRIRILKENIQDNPNKPNSYFQLAQIYASIDSVDSAMTFVEKALERDKTLTEANLLKADLFLNREEIKPAYEIYLDVLESEESEKYLNRIRNKVGKPYPIYQLTEGDFNNAFPSVSADDQRFVYQSDRDGNWEIYLMDVDGEQEVRLTNNLAQDEMPVFSPEENIIAFTSTRDDTAKKSRPEKNRNIFLMDLQNGKIAREIVHEADDWYPALIGDGREIVFVSERDDQRDVPFQERFSDLYYRNLKEDETIRLTQNQADDVSPSVSADGKWILFTSNRDGNYQIYKMERKSLITEQLTFFDGNCGAPHFSRDNDKICFFADFSGNYDIFIMDSDLKNVTKLTADPAQDTYPIFSPNKRKIFFQSNRTGKYQIYSIDLMSPITRDDLIFELTDYVNSH